MSGIRIDLDEPCIRFKPTPQGRHYMDRACERLVTGIIPPMTPRYIKPDRQGYVTFTLAAFADMWAGLLDTDKHQMMERVIVIQSAQAEAADD